MLVGEQLCSGALTLPVSLCRAQQQGLITVLGVCVVPSGTKGDEQPCKKLH